MCRDKIHSSKWLTDFYFIRSFGFGLFIFKSNNTSPLLLCHFEQTSGLTLCPHCCHLGRYPKSLGVLAGRGGGCWGLPDGAKPPPLRLAWGLRGGKNARFSPETWLGPPPHPGAAKGRHHQAGKANPKSTGGTRQGEGRFLRGHLRATLALGGGQS